MKELNSSTCIQPTVPLSRKEKNTIDNLIAEFCSACVAYNRCDCDECKVCAIRQFESFVKLKASILYGGKRLWIIDGTMLRFSYPDGSKFTYTVNVVDTTHVELRRVSSNPDDEKYGVLTLHAMQLESVLKDPDANVEIKSSEENHWIPFSEFARR